ncbi:MAG: hypothetical protein ABEJ03_04355 [Candidatus Nanohaloarchaea archaeon]
MSRRPDWLESAVKTKWIAFDSKTDRYRNVQARSQKEAIKRAIRMDVVPRSTDDVRPRIGGYSMDLMTPEEFEEFMKELES